VESHELADNAYKLSGDWMLNNGKVYNLDDAYYKKSKAVVDNQLLLAGVRLAAVLNEIFR
jgi:hypothetical protein